MIRDLTRSLLFQSAARLLVGSQIVAGLPSPAWAQSVPAASPQAPAPRPAGPENAARAAKATAPEAATPPSAGPSFSATPTDTELFRSRMFSEPLVPVGAATRVDENRALARALTAFRERSQDSEAPFGDAAQPIETFLVAHPSSPWRPSLLTNLGMAYRRTGYFSRALRAWEQAWELAKADDTPSGRAVADRALAEMAQLYARLGRYDSLRALFAEIEGRNVRGPAAELLQGAREGFWLMENEPGWAFRCGPMALASILAQGKSDYPVEPLFEQMQSTRQGTSLAQLVKLSAEAGLPMQVAFREQGSPVVAVEKAVVHWKAGHYAALVRRVGERWLVQDPTFGENIWVSTAALGDETSGYFLIPAGPLPEGWRSVPEAEAGSVWGKGAANTSDPNAQAPDDPKEPCQPPGDGGGDGGSGDESHSPCCPESEGGGGSGGNDSGMPAWNVHSMLVSLNVTDTPWRYSPPRGPAVRFQITYNQRDSFQPQTFNYSNLGYKWTFDWLSYVQETTSGSTTTISVYRRGGGREVYSFAGDTSSPHYRSRAVLVRTPAGTYERKLPNGSREIFKKADGTSPLRRFFLTKIIDPSDVAPADAATNALTFGYDGDLRLTTVTDALGQVSTLSYELGGAPGTPEFYRVTRVTDPFGRAAILTYNGSGQLASVTDAIGMTSTFDYDTGDFLRSMTTPYGSTQFQWGTVSNKPIDRYIEITDPLGEKQRVQFTTLGSLDFGPVPSVPGTNFQPQSAGHIYATAYWDKRSLQYAPDFSRASRQTIWLTTANGHEVSGVPHSAKLPLQARKWFWHPGQTSPWMWGSDSRPSVVARKLDDVSPAQTEVRSYEYSPQGKLTKYTDPVGRITQYTYQTSPVDQVADLVTVKQANPGALSGNGYDLLASYTYTDATHPTSIHRPLTFTDASRQQWTFGYNAFGQLTSVETPPRAGINENRITTLEYDAQGYLARLTGPSPQATYSFGYDMIGRARSATDPSGYTVLADYDALDRVVKTTYPDGSFEQTTYERLDAAQWRDRQGRITSTQYDALRRPISVRDPAGRVLRYEWCNCGSLSALIDARNNATRWERDDQNRVTKETRADGTFKTWQYRGKAGYLLTATNARSQTTTLDYSLDGRLKQVTNSDPNTPGFTLFYDSVYPRLTQVTDEAGLWQYGYYAVPPLAPAPTQLGATQVSSVDGPLASDTLSFTYDELGRRRSRTLAATTLGWDYDLLGRIWQHTTPTGAFTFGYDGGTSRLLSILYPSGQSTTYSYLPPSQDLRLAHIYNRKPGGAQLSHFAYTYDTVGNIRTWLNEVENQPTRTWTYGYDAADQLLSARLPGPDGTSNPDTYAYAYDDAGNRIAEQTANQNVVPPLIEGLRSTWTYDSMNQLVDQSAAGGGPVAMRGTTNEPATVTVGGQPANSQASGPGVAFDGTATPDANSRVIVQATDMSGLTTSNTYQIPASTGPRTFSYDLDGNMTSDGTRTFEWDAHSRLRRVLQGTTELARFKYDARGRRVQKVAAGVTRDYVYDGAELAEERASNGITLRFIHGPAIDQHLAQLDGSSSIRYFTADHLGSIVQQTDPSGNVTLTRQYDAWGNLLVSASAGRYAFTGREWDPETQLYYYRARYYDPKIGRFLSEDPIGLGAWPNLYAYVGSSPVVLVDPFGREGGSFAEKWKEFTEWVEANWHYWTEGGAAAAAGGAGESAAGAATGGAAAAAAPASEGAGATAGAGAAMAEGARAGAEGARAVWIRRRAELCMNNPKWCDSKCPPPRQGSYDVKDPPDPPDSCPCQ